MNEKKPVVSIITVCYNCEDTIEKTIKSVICQNYPDIQYIIIDGGSTDNTLNAISSFKDWISLVISEKDYGIYDAMNKGLSHVRGDLVYFLNSGDLLVAPDTIDKIVTVFRNNPDVSLVHGDSIGYGGIPDEYRSMYHKDTISYFSHPLCHQTLVTRKQVFDTVGTFDMHFSVFADRDWLLRCLFCHDEKISHIEMPVCYYLTGGFSSRKDIIFYKEKLRLLLKYFFNKRVIVQLVKHPWELLLVLGMMAYSQANIISITVFHRVFRMLWANWS